ncbi:MAG: FAD:protein FMN transferase [Burkholderiales bacterium]|nr:FAD:protein FMN transferase [Burkholderiales bacterium]
MEAAWRFGFEAMACRCEVQLAAEDEAQAGVLAQAAIAEVRRIQAKFSRYRADSVVSRINAAAGQDAVACDAETIALLDYAQRLYLLGDGLFDITSGVLRRAWNFREPKLPDTGLLVGLCALVDWPAVERKGASVRLPRAGMELDFGGFGKEYAVDRAADLLAARGVRHGYVNLGGDIRALGPKPDGSPWSMGIQHPRRPQELMASIPLVDGALATSGDYERFFELDGQRYCHVLNPRTGWPVGYWQSVSVTAPLAIVAGSLSTIAMLKGAAGRDFLEAQGANYLATNQAGEVFQPR